MSERDDDGDEGVFDDLRELADALSEDFESLETRIHELMALDLEDPDQLDVAAGGMDEAWEMNSAVSTHVEALRKMLARIEARYRTVLRPFKGFTSDVKVASDPTYVARIRLFRATDPIDKLREPLDAIETKLEGDLAGPELAALIDELVQYRGIVASTVEARARAIAAIPAESFDDLDRQVHASHETAITRTRDKLTELIARATSRSPGGMSS